MICEAESGVTLKLATSLDGRIATSSGESRWITGAASREQVHRLRALHDAVLVGVDTALADDPLLNVRLEGHTGAQPTPVILDTRQRISSDLQLVRLAKSTGTVVISTMPARSDLAAAGVRVLQVPAGEDGRCCPSAALEALAGLGLGRVFVEGGGAIASSFLKLNLVDRLEWFRAPMLIGAEGRPALGGLALAKLSEAPRFRRLDAVPLGEDLWERYERI